MDLSMVLPAVVILAAIILPIVYLNRAKANAEKKLIKALNSLAQQHATALGDFELMNNLALGIDSNNGVLFFVKRQKNEIVKTAIVLAQVGRSEVVETKTPNHYIDRLLWVFESTTKATEIVLEFYNAKTTNFSLAGEAALLNKWHTKVDGLMKKK